MSSPATDELRFGAGLSTAVDTEAALAEVAQQALAALDGRSADFAVMFVSLAHQRAFDRLGQKVRAATGARTLLGCTGQAIVGGQREIEEGPALCLWLAHLGATRVVPWQLRFENTPDGPSLLGWPDALAEPWPAEAALVALGEPFSFPADLLLERLNADRPGTPVFGGMASGAQQPGQHRLWCQDQCLTEGAVGVWLAGQARVRGMVSQGCEPIGRHLVVTKAERNVIYELGGQPPLGQFQALLPTLSPRQRRMVQQGLHVGRVTNEYQESFGRGDFLVRNVIGADPESGAIAIGDYVRVGQTVQFHVRDGQSADEDLRRLLAAAAPPSPHGRGALLFTCNGRGSHLFDQPHHDAQAICQAWGELPLAGFFAQGEMGPVGGKNFLHGFTASVALFESA